MKGATTTLLRACCCVSPERPSSSMVFRILRTRSNTAPQPVGDENGASSGERAEASSAAGQPSAAITQARSTSSLIALRAARARRSGGVQLSSVAP